MRIGLRLPPCRPANEMADAAHRAEELGFDAVWFPDSQLIWRDVFATLAVVATRTERIQIGTAVTNVETRHPTVLASAVRSIQELAPGRVVLGVGTGNSSLGPIGEAPTTRADLGAGLDVIRTLTTGGEVDLGGGDVRLRDPAGACPVYLAANGPKNLAFAGEVADGVILLSGTSTSALERSVGLVHEGVARAGRAVDAVDIVVSAYCHVTDDVARDAAMLKPICAAIAQTGGTQFLALAGIDISVPASVPDVYPDLVHAEDWPRAVEACGAWVSDDDALAFADAFCLFGTIDEIDARLRVLGDAGVRSVLVQHVGSYHLPIELMEGLGELIARAPA